MTWTLLALLAAAPTDPAPARDPLVLARPFELVVPPQAGPLPLVVLLHGYGSSGAAQDAYFRLSAAARERGFFLALPDGTLNKRGQRFWNATDACCGFGAPVDDVAYLTAVITDVQARYPVDAKRVFLVGHSNGGFMAHRMACERSELIAGIVSLAGTSWLDRAKCTPSTPVSVLQVHGTADTVIKWDGGALRRAPYAKVEETIAHWGARNGCTAAPRAQGEVDLVADLPLAETQREALEGCAAGGAVELWRIRGGPHSPWFRPSWAGFTFDWLMAHPKP